MYDDLIEWIDELEETRFEQTARKIVICIDRSRDKARERGRSRGYAREREDTREMARSSKHRLNNLYHHLLHKRAFLEI